MRNLGERTETFSFLPTGLAQGWTIVEPPSVTLFAGEVGTTEVVVCTKGRLRAGPDGEELDLGPGDAARFASDVPHRYEALRAARALCLMLYPAGGER